MDDDASKAGMNDASQNIMQNTESDMRGGAVDKRSAQEGDLQSNGRGGREEELP